jgi:hypothetical protein
MPIKSAAPPLMSLRQLTVLLLGSEHSKIGNIPVVRATEDTYSHFSFSSYEVIHQVELRLEKSLLFENNVI